MMKVLGVSGSPRKDKSTDRLVKEALDAVGVEMEFVSLAGKTIGPCIACLGCVKDNVCKVHDDMEQLRQPIVEADAYVIGTANYFSIRMNRCTYKPYCRDTPSRHSMSR